MARLLEFASNHYWLVSTFIGVLVALLWTSLQGLGSRGLSPQQTVLLLNRENAVPVDVRPEASFKAGHIINALNIAAADLETGLARLTKYQQSPLLVYCESGASAPHMAKRLQRAGFTKVYQLQGGVAAWRQENLPLETSK
ncbi:MAG: rhodanese-like domain-containing protein [Gammaproteobacteria bacterium]|nr:rhodanese-like domain-containing protein [Gammaproteobacteria bacterium]